MNAAGADRAVLAVLTACARAWVMGSCGVAAAVFLVAVLAQADAGLGSALGSSAAIATAAMMVALLVSFLFVFLIAAPAVLLVGRFLGASRMIDGAAGATVGAAAGFALAAVHVLPDFFWSALVAAVYGAATGHQLTRMIHA